MSRSLSALYIMSDDSQSDVEEIEHDKKYGSYEITPKYLQISKHLKVAKLSSETNTINALHKLETLIIGDKEKICVLRLGGVHLLVNLIKTEYQRSMIASLRVLKVLCTHYFIIDEVIKLEGLQCLVQLVGVYYKVRLKNLANKTLVILTLEVLQLLSVSRRAKRLIRSFLGIPHLLRFLSTDTSFYFEKLLEHDSSISMVTSDNSRAFMSAQGRKRSSTVSLNSKRFQYIDISELKMVQLASNILWGCSESKSNVASLVSYDFLNIAIELLHLQICEIDLPIMGIINQCCIVEEFCEEAVKSNLIYHCIRCLKHKNHHVMQLVSLQTICKCVRYRVEAKDMVNKLGGLKVIMWIIDLNENGKSSLLIATLHTLAQCLQGSSKNCTWFDSDGHLRRITDLIHASNNNKVIECCFAILKEFMDVSKNSISLLKILHTCIESLQLACKSVIVAVNEALKIGMKNLEFKRTLLLKDVLRLVWSNMNSQNSDVVSTSADVLYNLIDDSNETAGFIRAISGGLEMLVDLMESQINTIITSVGNLVSRVALDEENQLILVKFGILEVILSHCKTNNLDVRRSICSCIVSFASNVDLCAKLKGTIRYIGGWLHSSDSGVKHDSARALYYLSFDEENCIAMQSCGIFKHLIELMHRSDDEILQNECTRCVNNIKKIAPSVI